MGNVFNPLTIILAIISFALLIIAFLLNKKLKESKLDGLKIKDSEDSINKYKSELALKIDEIRRLNEELKKSNISEEEAIKRASVKAQEIILKAKSDSLDIKSEAELKIKKEYNELDAKEKRIDERENSLNSRSNSLDERYSKLDNKEKLLEEDILKVKKQKEDLKVKFENIAGMTRDEAKEQLMSQVNEELKMWTAKRIRENNILLDAKSDEMAQQLLIDAMARGATDYYVDATLTKFKLESEDQKGKIIGKEGRNIKTLEKLTGVDIVIDEDLPQISISCFDAVRREVACITLEKLLKDGRMHPGTIEDTVQKVKENIAREIKKNGEDLAFRAGCTDLPEEIIKWIGRFKYRFSYGQNLAKHTIEMIQIGEYIAKELKVNPQIVKTACLLHDVGKVMITEEDKRQHHHVSGELCRKYKMDERIINAVEAHHGDIAATCIEAEIVKLADELSGGRQGARRENIEEYFKRVKAIEEIAFSYEGVREAYAIHAGREVRVIVAPDKLNDDECTILAQDIAMEIKETQTYPGVVTVNVIREIRVKSEAK